MTKTAKIFFILITLVSIIISGWYVSHGSIIFHTDIARDFLLIEDIVKNKPLTLIGPRSGGIPGVFHGPLWLYINVPAFLASGGNPVAVGWFWLILSIINLVIVYYIAQKLFGDIRVSFYSVALTAAATALDIRSLYNPWGALMLGPIFFYLYFLYSQKVKPIYLVGALFILGVIIQFQMAFGIPLLLLTLIHAVALLKKKNKLIHLLAFLILLIPLSTFILFDLKHDFLQTKAILDFVTGKVNTGKVDMPFLDLVDDRVRRVFTDGLGFLTFNKWFLLLPLIYLLIKAGGEINKLKKSGERGLYLLFLYFYLGFWAITLVFKGQIWGYYHWPFVTLLSLFFVSLYRFVDKRLFYFLLLAAIFLNLSNGVKHTVKSQEYISEDGASWKFYNQMAYEIYSDAKQDFGYYIFSGDQFGYTQRYAMHYKQNEFGDIKAYSFEKKRITYLIITPTDNPFVNVDGWKAGQVKLTKKPLKVKKYKNGIIIEKYELTPEELKIPSDPNMIGATLLFR